MLPYTGTPPRQARLVTLVPLVAVLGLVGCAEVAMAPEAADVPLLAASAPGGPWTGHVSAGGTATHPVGVKARFSVNVFRLADGSATGKINYRFRDANGDFGNLFADVDCVVINGNRAWASGVITRVQSWHVAGLPQVPSSPFIVAIEDNEQDDLAWFNWAEFWGVTDCTGMPAIDPVSSEFTINGQFKIRER